MPPRSCAVTAGLQSGRLGLEREGLGLEREGLGLESGRRGLGQAGGGDWDGGGGGPEQELDGVGRCLDQGNGLTRARWGMTYIG